MSVLLDASALLALLGGEPGGDRVAAAIASGAAIGSVNLAEVASKLISGGVPDHDVRDALGGLSLRVLDFDEDRAYRTASLTQRTHQHGLSLGDCACLALAQRAGLPTLTADRSWGDLDVGVDLRLIR